ncbi:MAG: hypothetical protein ACTSO9_16730 [Candidatus Helarchaeota archaeon]
MDPIKIGKKFEVSQKNHILWTYQNKNLVMFNVGLLIFGTILTLINFYIIDSYVSSFHFMNAMRAGFDQLYALISAYADLQTPEYFKILYHIMISNFWYNNLVLMASPPSLFPFLASRLPNTNIMDFIVGFSLLIFSILNLILLNFDITKLFYKPIDFLFFNIFTAFAISGSLIGVLYINMFLIGFCTLYFVVILFFLINEIPSKKSKP